MKTTFKTAALLAVTCLLLSQAQAETNEASSTNSSGESSPGVIDKTGAAVSHGAKVAADAVEHGAKAAVNGIERGTKAAANGIERGAQATGRVVKKVAHKVGIGDSAEGEAGTGKPQGSSTLPGGSTDSR